MKYEPLAAATRRLDAFLDIVGQNLLYGCNYVQLVRLLQFQSLVVAAIIGISAVCSGSARERKFRRRAFCVHSNRLLR